MKPDGNFVIMAKRGGENNVFRREWTKWSACADSGSVLASFATWREIQKTLGLGLSIDGGPTDAGDETRSHDIASAIREGVVISPQPFDSIHG